MIRTLLFAVTCAQAQSWQNLGFFYDTQDLVWEKPRMDVSADDGVMVASFNSRDAGRSAYVSADDGASWSVMDSDFQHSYVGFDAQNNMYIVTRKKQSGASLTYVDSLYYSSDNGSTLQPLADLPDWSINDRNFYIDAQGRFYTPSNSMNGDLDFYLRRYQNGSVSDSIISPFAIGSDAMQAMILTSNGVLVISTFNAGVWKSTDGGASWVDATDETELGTSTFAWFTEGASGRLYLAGPSFRYSDDDGDTWVSHGCGTTPLGGFSKAWATTGGPFYALSPFAGIYESTDATNWTQISPANWSVTDANISDNYLYVAANDSVWRMPVNNQSSSIDELEELLRVKIAPNPAAGRLHIAWESDGPMEGT